MSKTGKNTNIFRILLFLSLFFLACSAASAVGIGAKDEKIIAGGVQEKEFFIINNEHKNVSVSIGIKGAEDGVYINPEVIHLSSEDYIKRFGVTLDFDKIKNYDNMKLFASETSEGSSSVVASANVMYKLPIETKSTIQEFSISEESVEDSESGQSDDGGGDYREVSYEEQTQEAKKPEYEKNRTPEIEEPSLNEPSAKAEEIKEVKKEEPDNSGNLRLLAWLLGLLLFILTTDIYLIRGRHPVKKYISKARRMGKSEEEVRKNLKKAGWSDLTIENHIKK